MTDETVAVEEQPEQPKLLGDKVEEVLDALGGKQVAALIERVTKKPCNCGARKQRINAVDQAGRAAYRSMANKVRDLVNGNATE